eukprot:COSAG02_NODE_6209_length_3724_cov_44.732690_3_plen_479_part_00
MSCAPRVASQSLKISRKTDQGLARRAAIFYHLFEDPGWFDTMGAAGKPFKLTAVCIMLAMNFLIIVSTFAFCLETLPEYSADPETRAFYLGEANPEIKAADWESWWWWIEVVCVFMFTIDLGVRFGASFPAGTAKTFVGDPMNWVDFLAIFPFYVKFVADDFLDLRFLRVVRLARVLRSIPSPRYQDVGRVVMELFVNAMAPLFVPLYFMILSMVTLSSIVYYSEAPMAYECHMPDKTIVKDWDNTPAKNLGCLDEVGCECAGTLMHYTALESEPRDSAVFSSIPDTFWWCAVTFTTVGYGDVNPITPVGQVLAAITMFIGIFFLAMPLAIVGGSFQDAWLKLDARAHQLEEEARQAEQGNLEVGSPLKKEEEDDEFYQDELQAVAHLAGATKTIAALVGRSRGVGGREGMYDEVQSLVDRSKELVQEMAKATEDAIIETVQMLEQQEQKEGKAQTRIVNPMQAEDDGVDPTDSSEME